MHKLLEAKIVAVLREGYSLKQFYSDLAADTTVGIVALPLAVAFAIASGVKLEQGLFTAIVAGFIISLLGGSRAQISGPTGECSLYDPRVSLYHSLTCAPVAQLHRASAS